MKYLKINIEKILSEICDNVYLENSDNDSSFPYLVYSLNNGTYRDGQTIYYLDVDIWDKSETTINIDKLAQKLKKLDKTTYIDKDVQFTMYFDRLLNAKSEHIELKRYTIIFEIRAIERS